MLTILHRHHDGSEQLFMAETIHAVQPDGEECVPVRAGKFIAHGVDMGGTPSDYAEFEIKPPFGAVFVMNDQGSTVARYIAPHRPVEQAA